MYVPKEVWTFWTKTNLFYNLLNSKFIFVKTVSMLKLENFLQSNFTDAQWKAAIQSNYTFTKNVTYWGIS